MDYKIDGVTKRSEQLVGKVTGKDGKQKPLAFDLTLGDVKHIRRCLHLYARVHPAEVEEHSVLTKFRLFGRRTGRRKDVRLKKTPCQECGTLKNLTKAHIIPLSNDGENCVENLRWLCRTCHDIEELERRQTYKKKELTIIRKRIKDLKNKS